MRQHWSCGCFSLTQVNLFLQGVNKVLRNKCLVPFRRLTVVALFDGRLALSTDDHCQWRDRRAPGHAGGWCYTSAAQ